MDWTDVRTITGSTVLTTQLLYRIKMRAYSTLGAAIMVLCQDLGITKTHIWWKCGATRPLRRRQRSSSNIQFQVVNGANWYLVGIAATIRKSDRGTAGGGI